MASGNEKWLGRAPVNHANWPVGEARYFAFGKARNAKGEHVGPAFEEVPEPENWVPNAALAAEYGANG